ncbi:MAG TPA: uroporphyrinogen decarboxylase family protein, partial [Candidatus Glassbacteria bacterium]|nr:uroporphyrinogen decarboxylase family protein [Candidatus Glassbacteria bacterium]
MTSLERYRAVLEHRPADFLPRLPILMQFAAEHIGSNYGAFASDYHVLVESNLACARDFGMDQVSTISDPYRETQGFGGEVIYVRDGVPRCPRPPLADHRNLRRLPRPDPLQAERMLDRVNAVLSYAGRTAEEFSILGWVEGPAAEAADLRGVSTFFLDLVDDPEWVCELMDICVDVGIEFARVQVEAGADTIGIGDAVASQISPQMYEQMVQPREKRLVAAIKATGARVRLHICGNTTHLLPGIAELGIDIMDVDHMVDMKTVRCTLGTGVCLAGNIDPASGVYSGHPEDIRSHVRHTYDLVGNPYMVTAGCEIQS